MRHMYYVHRLDPDVTAVKNLEAEASNTALKAKARASELKERTTCRELEQLKECVRELTVKNGRMQHDIARLNSALAVRAASTCTCTCALQPQHSRSCCLQGLLQWHVERCAATLSNYGITHPASLTY